MRYMKPTAAALALAVAALSFSGTAEAEYYHHHHRGGDAGGAAAAAGIFGFAAGAILGSALSAPRCPPGYYDCTPVEYGPPPVVYEPAYQPAYQPAPVYYAAPQPWSPDWYAYCQSRYRSFNGRTGYYLGYDHEYHFCQ